MPHPNPRLHRRHQPFTLALALLACGVLASAVTPIACRRQARPADPVIIIGIDGLEWRVVLELLHERRLPNLAALMRRGVYGELRSLKPTMSPIIWTSIATGVGRQKHGIAGFVRRARDGSNKQVVFASTDRKRKALWNILSDAGRRVHIIGWWNTYPVEQINGVMIAQVNTTTLRDKIRGTGIWKGSLIEGLKDQVYPTERAHELTGVLPEVEQELPKLEQQIFAGASQNPSALAARLWEQSRWSMRADAVYERIAQRLIGEDGFDLFAVYFGGADVTGHRFWRYMQPDAYVNKPEHDEARILQNVIRDYCVHLDGVVGRLLAAAPSNVNVLIVSDHGMQPHNVAAPFRPGDPAHKIVSAAHGQTPPGVLIAAGPAIRAAYPERSLTTLQRRQLEEIGSVLDIAPTTLALLRMPGARDFDGAVLSGIFNEDFRRTPLPATIDTYTEPGWAEARRDAVGEVNMAERIEQLRALGYLQ